MALELFYILGLPLSLAVGAAWLQRTGGARRLCVVAGIGTVLFAALALMNPDLIFYRSSPRTTEGIETWTLPVSFLASTAVTQLLTSRRVPMLARVGLAWATALFVTVSGVWVT